MSSGDPRESRASALELLGMLHCYMQPLTRRFTPTGVRKRLMLSVRRVTRDMHWLHKEGYVMIAADGRLLLTLKGLSFRDPSLPDEEGRGPE